MEVCTSNVMTVDSRRRVRLAQSHHSRMIAKYSAATDDSVARTVIVTKDVPLKHTPSIWAIKIEVKAMDSVAALGEVRAKNPCVLNFASYKHPGGGFMSGSMAQEESLCHASNLYEILSRFQDSFYRENLRHLCGNMYSSRMLYTPDVIFETDEWAKRASVITCAAPNRGASHATVEVNSKCLRTRIDLMFTLAETMHVDTFIVGAWGCGVFKQDPVEVATLMAKRAKEFTGGHVIFAIPHGRNGHYYTFQRIVDAIKGGH